MSLNIVRSTGTRFVQNGAILRNKTRGNINLTGTVGGKRSISGIAETCLSLMTDPHVWSGVVSTVGLVGTSKLVYQIVEDRRMASKYEENKNWKEKSTYD